jgi:hypothetical protein
VIPQSSHPHPLTGIPSILLSSPIFFAAPDQQLRHNALIVPSCLSKSVLTLFRKMDSHDTGQLVLTGMPLGGVSRCMTITSLLEFPLHDFPASKLSAGSFPASRVRQGTLLRGSQLQDYQPQNFPLESTPGLSASRLSTSRLPASKPSAGRLPASRVSASRVSTSRLPA